MPPKGECVPSTTSVNYPKSEIEGHHQRAFEENNGTTKKGIFELGRPDKENIYASREENASNNPHKRLQTRNRRTLPTRLRREGSNNCTDKVRTIRFKPLRPRCCGVVLSLPMNTKPQKPCRTCQVPIKITRTAMTHHDCNRCRRRLSIP